MHVDSAKEIKWTFVNLQWSAKISEDQCRWNVSLLSRMQAFANCEVIVAGRLHASIGKRSAFEPYRNV